MSSENSELPKFTLTKEFFPNKSFNVQAKLWRVKLCTQCSATHQKRAPCLIDGSDLPSGCWGVPQGFWKNSSYPVSHLSSPWRVNFFNHFWGWGGVECVTRRSLQELAPFFHRVRPSQRLDSCGQPWYKVLLPTGLYLGSPFILEVFLC